MLSRLRHLADNMAVEILGGVIEVDEAFVGGRNRNRHAKNEIRELGRRLSDRRWFG